MTETDSGITRGYKGYNERVIGDITRGYNERGERVIMKEEKELE